MERYENNHLLFAFLIQQSCYALPSYLLKYPIAIKLRTYYIVLIPVKAVFNRILRRLNKDVVIKFVKEMKFEFSLHT